MQTLQRLLLVSGTHDRKEILVVWQIELSIISSINYLASVHYIGLSMDQMISRYKMLSAIKFFKVP